MDGRFSTFVKARIFCEREVPPGRQFVGTIDYQYNEICKSMCTSVQYELITIIANETDNACT